jgi:hypothetical protein
MSNVKIEAPIYRANAECVKTELRNQWPQCWLLLFKASHSVRNEKETTASDNQQSTSPHDPFHQLKHIHLFLVFYIIHIPASFNYQCSILPLVDTYYSLSAILWSLVLYRQNRVYPAWWIHLKHNQKNKTRFISRFKNKSWHEKENSF